MSAAYIAVLAFIAGIARNPEAQAESDPGQFKSMYIPKLEAWESKLSNIQARGTCEIEHRRAKGAGTTDAVDVKVYSRGRKRRVDIHYAKKGGDVSIVIAPPDMFAVSRKGEGDPYALDTVEASQNSGPHRFLVDRYAKILAFAPINMGHLSMRELVESPGFSAGSIKRYTEDGKELVRVEFARPSTAESRGFEGYFVLDGGDFGILEYKYHDIKEPAIVFEGSVQYRKSGQDELPMPDVVVFRDMPGPAPSTVLNCTFSEYKNVEVPEDYFTLEQFGLRGFEMSGATSPIWYFVYAAIALLLASALYWVSQRVRR
jgi:hypothetical protein